MKYNNAPSHLHRLENETTLVLLPISGQLASLQQQTRLYDFQLSNENSYILNTRKYCNA